jgi:predicted TPR repeat methyltransferase
LAASFDKLGDPQRAESVLAASYDAGVRDPDVLLRLGEHLERSGARDAAAKRFLEVLDLRPDDPRARERLAGLSDRQSTR